MTEGERIQLYNDLCDFKEELEGISYPSQSRKIDILARAVAYVRGDLGIWNLLPTSQPVYEGDRLTGFSPVLCSHCAYSLGVSSFKFCPQCGTKMRKK